MAKRDVVTTSTRAPQVHYSDDLLEKMMELVATGTSLSKVCELPGMPDRTTVLRWIAKDPNIKTRYDSAIAMRAEMHADQIIEIADTPASAEFCSPKDPSGVNHRRLQIDARKWIVCKLLPKVYGDKPETAAAILGAITYQWADDPSKTIDG